MDNNAKTEKADAKAGSKKKAPLTEEEKKKKKEKDKDRAKRRADKRKEGETELEVSTPEEKKVESQPKPLVQAAQPVTPAVESLAIAPNPPPIQASLPNTTTVDSTTLSPPKPEPPPATAAAVNVTKSPEEEGKPGDAPSPPKKGNILPTFVASSKPTGVEAPKPGTQKAKGAAPPPSSSFEFLGPAPWVKGKARIPKVPVVKFRKGCAFYVTPDDNYGFNRGYPLEPMSYELLSFRELDQRSVDAYHDFAVPLEVELPTPGDYVDIYDVTKDKFNAAYDIISGEDDQLMAHFLRELRADRVRRLPAVVLNGLTGHLAPGGVRANTVGSPVPIIAPENWSRAVAAGMTLMEQMHLTATEAIREAQSAYFQVATYAAEADEPVIENEVLYEDRYRISLPYHAIPAPVLLVPQPRPPIRSYQMLARTRSEFRVHSLSQASVDFATSGVDKNEVEAIENRFRQLLASFSLGNPGSAASYNQLLAKGFAGGAYHRFRVRFNITTPKFPTTLAACCIMNRIPLAFLDDGGHHALYAMLVGLQITDIPQNLVATMTNQVLRNAWAGGSALKMAVVEFLNRVLNPLRWAPVNIPNDPIDRPPVLLPAGYVNRVEIPGRHLDAGEITRLATLGVGQDFVDAMNAPNGSVAALFRARWQRPLQESVIPNVGLAASIVVWASKVGYAYRYGTPLPMAAGLPMMDVIDITPEGAVADMTYGIGDVYRRADVGTSLVLCDQIPVIPPPEFEERLAAFPKSFLKIDYLISLLIETWNQCPWLHDSARELKDFVYRVFHDKICHADAEPLEWLLEELIKLRDSPGHPVRGRLPDVDMTFIRARWGVWRYTQSLYSYVKSDSVFFDSRNLTMTSPVGHPFYEPSPPNAMIRVNHAVMMKYHIPTDLRWLHAMLSGEIAGVDGPVAPTVPIRFDVTTFWKADVLGQERNDKSQPPVIDVGEKKGGGRTAPPSDVDGPSLPPYTLTRSNWKNRYKAEALTATYTVQPVDHDKSYRLWHVTTSQRPLARIYMTAEIINGAPTFTFRMLKRNTLFDALHDSQRLLVFHSLVYVVPRYKPATLISVAKAGGVDRL